MIGKTFSRYTIVEKIGEGGMGVVYKAHDCRLRRDVAIQCTQGEITNDDDAVQRNKENTA